MTRMRQLFFERVLTEVRSDVALSVAGKGVAFMTFVIPANTLPDSNFLDLNMLQKDYFPCVTEVRNNEKWKNIRVIILSASSSHNHQLKSAYKSGADLYLQKSTSYTEFKQVLRRCLERDWSRLKQLSVAIVRLPGIRHCHRTLLTITNPFKLLPLPRCLCLQPITNTSLLAWYSAFVPLFRRSGAKSRKFNFLHSAIGSTVYWKDSCNVN